jgi:hypothetical protein
MEEHVFHRGASWSKLVYDLAKRAGDLDQPVGGGGAPLCPKHSALHISGPSRRQRMHNGVAGGRRAGIDAEHDLGAGRTSAPFLFVGGITHCTDDGIDKLDKLDKLDRIQKLEKLDKLDRIGHSRPRPVDLPGAG